MRFRETGVSKKILLKLGSRAASSLALMTILVATQSGCRAEESWPLWEQYTQRFMDGQGRIIDHDAGERTTSEGQSYALFFALVANDHARFDKLLHWTEENLAGGNLTERLPAWSWGQSPNGSWGVLDSNSAADSDLWIAYSLLEAGRLWHEPRYTQLGSSLANRIAHEEVALVPGLGTTLIAGAHGFHPSVSTWIVNPSYLPLPVLTRFAGEMPGGPWASVIASLQPMLARGSGAGYAMDWVSAGNGVHPASAPGTPGAIAVGSYDAIRVYLWLGISDPATPGREESIGELYGMAGYMKDHPAPPATVDAIGRVVDPKGPVGFSAALAPFLQAARLGAQARIQAERVAAARNAVTGLYGPDGRYYDQNLVLFSTGWSEQRYRFDRNGRLILKWK
jgi:endoglucanase